MKATPKPPPDAAYMTGNGTVFRDQTTQRYVTHPHRNEAVWVSKSPESKLGYMLNRQQTAPTLELPSFSPLYGGSGRLQQSSSSWLGKVDALPSGLQERRSTGYFGV